MRLHILKHRANRRESGRYTVGRIDFWAKQPLRCVRRTYGRWTDTSDVITKPKFLAFTGYQILLAMGLRSRALRARELRYLYTKAFVVTKT